MIFVIAKSVLVDPAAKAAFIEAYKENLPNVLAEKGCIRYDLAEDFNSGLLSSFSFLLLSRFSVTLTSSHIPVSSPILICSSIPHSHQHP